VQWAFWPVVRVLMSYRCNYLFSRALWRRCVLSPAGLQEMCRVLGGLYKMCDRKKRCVFVLQEQWTFWAVVGVLMGYRCNYLFSRTRYWTRCVLACWASGDVPCAWWALEDVWPKKRDVCVFVLEEMCVFFLTKTTLYILSSRFTNRSFKEGRIIRRPLDRSTNRSLV
jgi:hypothetical protein